MKRVELFTLDDWFSFTFEGPMIPIYREFRRWFLGESLRKGKTFDVFQDMPPDERERGGG